MGEMVRMQVDLPREVIDLLKQREDARGITLPQQIQEAVRAYLAGQEEPILRADDPLYRIAGGADSGVGDLSTGHDHYLYGKDRQQGETSE